MLALEAWLVDIDDPFEFFVEVVVEAETSALRAVSIPAPAIPAARPKN
jgi:hypothetical protein